MPIYVYCQGMRLGDGVDGLDTPNYAVREDMPERKRFFFIEVFSYDYQSTKKY